MCLHLLADSMETTPTGRETGIVLNILFESCTLIIHFKEVHSSKMLYLFHAGKNFVQIKPLGNHCSGIRHGLGSDTADGIGVESLPKCAEYALSDPRCDGTGFFDAREKAGSYQCKCPENGACLIDPGSSRNWSIYQATYRGTYYLDHKKYNS